MENTLICNINTFSFKHKIFYNENCVAETSIKDLPSTIMNFISTNPINIIHLYGNESFLEPLIEDLASKIKLNYSNIKIEVN